MARKHLFEIIGEDPSLSVTEIEITFQPIKIWRQGIHMIPAFQINQQTLSGIYLTKKQIKNFIQHSKLKTQTKA
jgi:hypothetical protein